MTISLGILVFACSIFQVSGICNFPCEWIGKTFEYVIPNNAIGVFVFDAVNKSAATLEVTFTTVEGGFTVNLGCEQIRGHNLILSWDPSYSDVVGDKACITVKLITPDIFAFIGRSTLQEVQADPNLPVTNAPFCDVCFRASTAHSIQLVARGGEPLDCVGDTPCIEKDAKACKKLGSLQPCPGNKFAAHGPQ